MTNPHNQPSPSLELQILNCLYSRMKLSPNESHHYENLLKGYKGERKFYELLHSELSTNCIVLYDLLLECNQTLFQIDSLLIYHDTVILFEIKNYEGDFYIQRDKWFAETNKEIRNPLLQLERSEFLLRTLLQQLGNHYSVQSHLVFVNKAFTLYQAPLNIPVIFPTQISRFIQTVNAKIQSAIVTKNHRALAKRLIDMNVNQSPNRRHPQFTFDQIKKGIICSSCSGFLSYHNYKILVCNKCKAKEDIETAVIRTVDEFKLLFPDKKITTQLIYEWCKVIKSKRTIRRILMKHLLLKRKGRYSHFVMKSK